MAFGRTVAGWARLRHLLLTTRRRSLCVLIGTRRGHRKAAIRASFDAPRASTLCALRAVQDAGFGLQVIGRIMRVHPLLQLLPVLPAPLNTGYVFLGDAESQAGLQAAADRVRAIRDAIEVCTDSISIYVAAADDAGEITVEDENGQRLFVLESPIADEAEAATSADSFDRALPLNQALPTQFGQFELASPQAPAPLVPQRSAETFDGKCTGVAAPVGPRPAHSYPMRTDVPVPKRLLTEKMPADMKVLVDTLVDNVSFTAEHRAMVRQLRTDVERRETELFSAVAARRIEEQAAISEMFAQESAFRALRVSEHIDPQDLARRLPERLHDSIERAGEDAPDQRALRRGLNIWAIRLAQGASKSATLSCVQ